MTINITLSEQDIAQASKALTELIQTCAEAAQTDAPRNNNNNNNNTVPKAKAKPKAEPAAPPQAELIATEPPAEEDSKPDETAVDYAELRDALKAECAAIARAGKSAGLKQLLVDYGAEKLSELLDDKLEEFRTAARAL